jgi:translation initiation factor 2 beta subunit (eIF-2beta)/eIF-5
MQMVPSGSEVTSLHVIGNKLKRRIELKCPTGLAKYLCKYLMTIIHKKGKALSRAPPPKTNIL